MPTDNRTFRVFVSSTFSDLKAERNALQEKVFPRLRELAAAHGCRFQAVDLRWGISEEATIDQKTMEICLAEVKRCQRTHLKPNFIILLGNRYGWRPLPYEIPAEEFERLLPFVSEEEQALLIGREDTSESAGGWYRRDENAVPPVYLLKPRSGEFLDYEHAWKPLEVRLYRALASAAEKAHLSSAEMVKYTASATEQEILQGAIQVLDASEHIFCFSREIEGFPADQSAADYLDLVQGKPDADAAWRMEDLKGRLRDVLGPNYHEYPSVWQKDAPSLEHLDRMCADVYQELEKVILREVAHLEQVSPLQREIDAHQAFGQERTRNFTGRLEILKNIDGYLLSENSHPLAVQGPSGAGKSALIARAFQKAEKEYGSKAVLVCRYIKTTPESSDGRALLESLCLQISQEYGEDVSKIPYSFFELAEKFASLLKVAKASKPLFIFLDALDQMGDADQSRSLAWLPRELPPHAKFILTTLPGECLESLENKLPEGNILPLEIMSMEEGRNLLDRWLEEAGRCLQPGQRSEVLEKYQGCRLPLFLKLAFEEVRHWRSFDGLPAGADGNPGLGRDIQGILQDLFWRLSLKSNHDALLVSRSLAYLAAAKNGLAEDELLDVLSRDREMYAWFLDMMRHTPADLVDAVLVYLGPARCAKEGLLIPQDAEKYYLARIRPDQNEFERFLDFVTCMPAGPRLPMVLWSRLFIDLEPYLAARAADFTNLISFYHENQLRQAVTAAYLQGDEKADRHRLLAGYFGAKADWIDQARGEPDRRKTSELPYQQAQAGMLNELSDTLTSLSFLQAKLCATSPLELVQDYEMSLAHQENDGLRLIAEALRISSHILRLDYYQLAPQLLGRLLAYRHPEIIGLLAQANSWKDRLWLRPLTACLTPAGGPERFTLTGHSAEVCSVMVTPDGALAVSGGGGNEDCIKIWDLKKMALIHTSYPFSYAAHIRAITPDGKKVVASDWRKALIFDLGTRKVLASVPGTALAVSADCRVVIASKDNHPEKGHTVKCWDLEQGQERFTFPADVGEELISGAALSPDGLGLAFRCGNQLAVWELDKGQEVLRCIGHTAPITSVAYTPDGQLLVSAGAHEALRAWRLEDGREMASLPTGERHVGALVISPDGQLAFTLGEKTILIWDLENGQERFTLSGHQENVTEIAVSRDGRRAVSAAEDKTLIVWDLENGQQQHSFRGHTEQINQVAITPDGRYVLSASDDHTIKVWDMDGAVECPPPVGHSACVNEIAVTEDGRRAVSAADDCMLKVWKLDSGAEQFSLGGHTQLVASVKTTPDGKLAVSASFDHSLKVWDVESGALLSTLKGHTAEVTDVAITPDGSTAISASQDKTLKVWDLEKAQERFSLAGHSEGVNHVVVTPDGCLAVSGSQDKTVRLWDLSRGIERATLSGHASTITCLAVSPDSRLAVSGSENNKLIVWDLVGARATFNLNARGSWGFVKDVLITPDQKQVISLPFDEENEYNISLVDYTLTVWELATGRPRRALEEHLSSLQAAAVLPDGNWLLSTSLDKKLKLWDLAKGECILTYEGDAPFNCSPQITLDPYRIIVGDTLGRIHILSLEGLESEDGKTKMSLGAPLVTARCAVEKDAEYSIRCPYCRADQAIPESDLDMQIPCTACGRLLRLNPFTVITTWPPVSASPEPDSVQAIMHTRESLEKEGISLLKEDPARALACFESALVLEPNDSALLKRRVTALSGMGKFELAAEALDGILNNFTRKGNEEMGSLYAAKGNAYYRMGAPDRALKCYQTALDLEPGLANAWYMQGVVWFDKDEYEKALGSFEQARELKMEGNIPFYIGTCYVRLGRYPDAETIFESLIANGFPDAAVYFTLGVTKRNLGKSAQARTCLEKFLETATAEHQSMMPKAKKMLEELSNHVTGG